MDFIEFELRNLCSSEQFHSGVVGKGEERKNLHSELTHVNNLAVNEMT